MSMLLLALALMAPAAPASHDAGRDRGDVSCSVDVRAVDPAGRVRPARGISARTAPAVLFRGKLSQQDDETPPLLFDVFNPRGQRYQVLVAERRVATGERDGRRVKLVSKVGEANLAVAGSSIALTSMYGKWRVEPRLEGETRPCGRAEYFTIRP
jgi:hypothetical protein